MDSTTLFDRIAEFLKKNVKSYRFRSFFPSQSAHKKVNSAPSRSPTTTDEARAVIEALALLSADPNHEDSSQSSPSPSSHDLSHDPPESESWSKTNHDQPSLAEELASLIELDQRYDEQATPARPSRAQISTATFLLSSGAQHLSLRASAWEVLWITIKLAKVFSHERCDELAQVGGALSVFEMQQIKLHIEQVLLKNMESGDYLFADLSLSDVPPDEAFMVGDARREQYLDRAALHQLVMLAQDVRAAVMVRRLQWRHSSAQVPLGDINANQRARRKAR